MREERKVAATRRLGGWAVGLGAALLFASSPALAAQDTTKGKAVYVSWCAGCHGDAGDGQGYAATYMQPRPRDFTGAIYKIRTTASGQIPTDADILRAIDEGLPGTAMPAWKERLSDGERRDLVAYIKTFSSFFADTSQHVEPLKFASEPGGEWLARRSAEDRATDSRLDQVPEVSRRPGTRRRALGPDAQGRCRPRDFRGEPASELAVPRRSRPPRTSTTGCVRASTARRCPRSPICSTKSSSPRTRCGGAPSTSGACRPKSRPR